MAKKVILYGNEKCPTCLEVKAVFDREGIRYGYVDILAGLAHLKKFMNLRDSNPDAFRKVVENGKIGIPAVVVDDSVVYGELEADEIALDDFR
ncbi:glutaredoxin [Eubacteriales bacterium OttesenSCG-928-M02]|nr:glutaredoxin [Eubacteriales bacterium OttesenSCG-928-M02]